MSKTFLIDVDGVVANLLPEWLRKYNTDYDDQLQVEDIKTWGIHEYVNPKCGTEIYDYLGHDDLYDDVQPFDGALSTIRWLRNEGHYVIYVTSGIQPAKILWLNNHGFLYGRNDWMFADDVIIAHDKSRIKGDYLIDDYIVNCNNFGGTALLFNAHYNINISTGLYRVGSWADIMYYITRHL